MNDLEKKLESMQHIMDVTPSDFAEQADILDSLGVELRNQFQRSRDMEDLETAIISAQQAVYHTQPDDPAQATYLNNLGLCFVDRFEANAAIGDLETAITTAEMALDVTNAQHPNRPLFLNNLGNGLKTRFTQTGTIADLEKAIRITQEATNATPQDHDNRSMFLSNLGSHLGTRFARTGDMVDLEEAIERTRQAVKITPSNHGSLARRLGNLGVLFRDKFGRTGLMADLEEAIKTTEEAINAASQDDANLPVFLSNLGNSLGDRFKRTGAIADLHKAIEASHKAVEAIPSGHYHGASLNNLGILLGDKFARTGATEDLEEAIKVARLAVDATPLTHPERAKHLNNLALRLGDKFETTRAADDLEEAIETVRLAVQGTPLDHPDRVGCVNNLEGFLRYRFASKGNIADLEEAIVTAQQAFDAIPPNHIDRAACLNNIGHGLAARFAAKGAPADLEMSYRRYVSAFNQEASSIYERIKAARSLLSSPFLLQDKHNQFEYASQSIELLPHLTPHSLQNADKQHLLLEAAGLASDAAAIALISQDSPPMAVSWLETGRGVLASALQYLRADLSALQKRHHRLSASFEAFRAILDSPIPPILFNPNEDTTFNAAAETSKRTQAQKQLDQLIGEIRRHPGFDRFLLPPTTQEIQCAGVHGPIIVINISRHRCDALVVLQTDIRCIELTRATYEEIHKRRQSVSLTSSATLEWLWDSIVHPILERLGYTQRPAHEECPRIWWIPTGPLVGFPLHAAGYHLEGRGRTALDQIASSYATSLQSIIHTRQKQPAKCEGANMVLVAMENTPGNQSLNHAGDEISAVRAFSDLIHVKPTAPEKTKEEVQSSLEFCQVFHFAGHGRTDPRQPLRSLLLLDDWKEDPMTVGGLLETNLQRKQPFLAYLSACGTTQVSDDRSVDENIHLTSAFQLAGFRHVIGTLWQVDDGLCVDMARLTYDFLGRNGLNDESVSRGLHNASKTLRDQWVARQMGIDITAESVGTGIRDGNLCEDEERDPLHWVPYVHFGV